MDSRLRGNDRHLDRFVIPAKAGIQALLPGLIEKLRKFGVSYQIIRVNIGKGGDLVKAKLTLPSFAVEVIFGNKPGKVGSLNIHFFRGLAPVAAGMFEVQSDESFLEFV
jgi:hypothetical protein